MSEKLRIAIFSDSALPILNGVSVSIQSLVSELRNQGHSVTIFTAKSPGYKDSDPNIYRFPAIETPWTKGYPLAYPPFMGTLRKFRRHTFDVIHTHTPFTIGFVGLRWAESHEIPIVSTYHTLYDRYAHYIPFFPRRYIRFKIAKHTNFYYNHVDHVITPSVASYKWLRRHSVTTPTSVVPTGTPPRGFIDRAEMRHRLGIPPGQRIMLYVGRIAREKNLPALFAMAARVIAEEPDVRLWLVGDGPYRQEALAMARELGIGDRVQFVGFVPREHVDRYYAAADLFVFSSITETQGLVVQEAMTYGLPAIAVAGGGASAAIQNGENGFVAKNEVEDFTAHVLRVLRDEDLFSRLSEGASRTVRSYTTADMARAVLQVYGKVIHSKRAEQDREKDLVGA
ncbi:MAG TPA: glycosyltransferase [Fimbriimonadaceae bacterium]|nr:glycosyltransferase [Fimbriimonadaceae bacterium]